MKSRVLYYSFIYLLFILVGLTVGALFYLYEEGMWRELLHYYKLFFDPKKLKFFIISYGEYAPFVFVGIQALQVVFAPIPGEVTGFVGGLLFGTVKGLALSMVGLTLGSLFAFFLSRFFGMRFVERVVKKEYIEGFNNFITHKGLGLVFILYLIPGFPKDMLSFLLGITHIGVLDFIIVNILGRLPGTFMLSLQGNALRNAEYKTLLLLILVSVVIVLVLYLCRGFIGKLIGYPVHLLFRKRKH
ncbi:MAG: TVP38/TMEM64 family protein [Deltaproteobacteria bacterium]|nr:TVP38/TMEM64 family protein [Deltaproteobacteria bacterium]